MLTALHLGNFKAFAETQRIPIRPLTLIYGANSSGKSSIIHSLILARDAMETGDLDIHRTNIGGEAVDLGGFRQYVHRREANRRMEWAIELDTRAFEGRLAALFATVRNVIARLEIGLAHVEKTRQRPGIDPRTGKSIMIEEPTGELVPVGKPSVQAFKLEGDAKPLLHMSRRQGGLFQLDSLDHQHPVFREVVKAIIETSTTAEALHPSDFEGLDEAVAAVVPDIVATSGRLLPANLAKSEAFSPAGQPALFPISKGRRREDLAAAIRFFLPRTVDELLQGVSAVASKELRRLKYLGPLRYYPPRHLAFAQHHDPNWLAGGGYAWDVVRQDAVVREMVNKWLSSSERLQTPYQLEVTKLVPMDKILDLAKNALEEYYDTSLFEKSFIATVYEGGKETDESDEVTLLKLVSPEKLHQIVEKGVREGAIYDPIRELTMLDMRSNTPVTHRDVGIGVSQVLPVLVEAYAEKNKIIAIEQPEIHLHPALQADLGDVFLQSALGESQNRFLIETHSEHLLLRIMRRMRETAGRKLPAGVPELRPDDVCVLFVEPDGSRSIIREMPLNERGELVKAWPGGFFEEGLREIF